MYPDFHPCFTNPARGSIQCTGQFGCTLASRNLEKREQRYQPCTAPPRDRHGVKDILTPLFRRKS